MTDDTHGDVCDECKGTGRVPTKNGTRFQECDDCYSGVNSSDEEMCNLAQCDFCRDPNLRDEPAAKYR